MRWILIGALVVTAGCGAILAGQPRADEGLEMFYGATTAEVDEKMNEKLAEDRAASDLDDTYTRLEEKWSSE
jgi:hypothetical protein